jgi:hypothetical protein
MVKMHLLVESTHELADSLCKKYSSKLFFGKITLKALLSEIGVVIFVATELTTFSVDQRTLVELLFYTHINYSKTSPKYQPADCLASVSRPNKMPTC